MGFGYKQWEYLGQPINFLAQEAGAVEYSDCISAEGGEDPPTNVRNYDAKQSDGELPVILKLWEMRSTPSLSSLPGPLWPEVVAP